jgi:uncharacterized protein (DUF2141 family)
VQLPPRAVTTSSTATPTLGQQRSTLIVELADLRNEDGVVCVALFSSSLGFPNDPDQAIRSGCFAITEQPLTLTFPNLPHGFYAIAVHHDENMDGKLNCNTLGIPKEGIGFSGNPRIWKGAPSFEKAAFEFSPDVASVSVTMKYLLR